MALDSSNNPHIIYDKTTAVSTYQALSSIEYAVWTANSGWNIQSVLNGNDSVENMALDSNGYPHFLYVQNYPGGNAVTSTTLGYDSWNGSAWNTQTVASNLYDDSGGGYFTLDSNGYPCIDYFNSSQNSPEFGDLMYATWAGTTWDIQTVDSNSVTSSGPIALDSNGNPYIIYSGPTTLYARTLFDVRHSH